MKTNSLFKWKCVGQTLELGQVTRVMGILNATPDSFSDGGHFSDLQRGLDRALEMEAEGADILDIGGESSRPGASSVPLEEEIRRTIPLIEKIREQTTIPISIDTTKAEVARLAMEAGANIINDISAMEGDPEMPAVVAKYGAGIVLMHKQGTPEMMQQAPSYRDVVKEVGDYLKERVDFAIRSGIPPEQIILDPGIGFGKTTQHNIQLLQSLSLLNADNPPFLVGASRKRFIGELTGRSNPEDRLAGSLAVAAWAVMHGAAILRVHDVIETCNLCRLLDTLRAGTTLC